MKIQDITTFLENIAPLSLQEDYDNAGLLTGSGTTDCTGILISLDITTEVIEEAIQRKCNLIIAHHPVIFRGLKKLQGKNHVEQAVIASIKHDIALYAIHTNLDNVMHGVNGKIANLLQLTNQRVLQSQSGTLKKLSVYVPETHKESLLKALFDAGAGNIGNYSECSFSSNGEGTFMGNDKSNPYIGQKGQRHTAAEVKIEIVFPNWMGNQILNAMRTAHPYEEVAYYVYNIDNQYNNIGSGLVGELTEPMEETDFLKKISAIFKVPVIKHTALTGKKIRKVAVCGGAGSFLTPVAMSSGADIYITSDIKYHEFFDVEGKMILADIGHFESEQYTIDLLSDLLSQKFPNFAVLKTGVSTNPVRYFIN